MVRNVRNANSSNDHCPLNVNHYAMTHESIAETEELYLCAVGFLTEFNMNGLDAPDINTMNHADKFLQVRYT